jgi:hypothetical protein
VGTFAGGDGWLFGGAYIATGMVGASAIAAGF